VINGINNALAPGFTLTALNASTGAQMWLNGDISCTFVNAIDATRVSPTSVVVVLACNTAYHGLDSLTGAVLWTKTVSQLGLKGQTIATNNVAIAGYIPFLMFPGSIGGQGDRTGTHLLGYVYLSTNGESGSDSSTAGDSGIVVHLNASTGRVQQVFEACLGGAISAVQGDASRNEVIYACPSQINGYGASNMGLLWSVDVGTPARMFLADNCTGTNSMLYLVNEAQNISYVNRGAQTLTPLQLPAEIAQLPDTLVASFLFQLYCTADPTIIVYATGAAHFGLSVNVTNLTASTIWAAGNPATLELTLAGAPTNGALHLYASLQHIWLRNSMTGRLLRKWPIPDGFQSSDTRQPTVTYSRAGDFLWATFLENEYLVELRDASVPSTGPPDFATTVYDVTYLGYPIAAGDPLSIVLAVPTGTFAVTLRSGVRWQASQDLLGVSPSTFVVDGVTLVIGDNNIFLAIDRLGNILWNTSVNVGSPVTVGSFGRFIVLVDMSTANAGTLTYLDLYNGAVLGTRKQALSANPLCNTEAGTGVALAVTVGPAGDSIVLATPACTFLINSTWQMTTFINGVPSAQTATPQIVVSESKRYFYIVSSTAVVTKVDVSTRATLFQVDFDVTGSTLLATSSEALLYVITPFDQDEDGSITVLAVDAVTGATLTSLVNPLNIFANVWGDYLVTTTSTCDTVVYSLEPNATFGFELVTLRSLNLSTTPSPFNAPPSVIVAGDLFSIQGLSCQNCADVYNLTTGQPLPNQPLVPGPSFTGGAVTFPNCQGFSTPQPLRGALTTFLCGAVAYVLDMGANSIAKTFSLPPVNSFSVFVSSGAIVVASSARLAGVFVDELAIDGYGPRPVGPAVPPFTLPANYTPAPAPTPPPPTLGPEPRLPHQVIWRTSADIPYQLATGATSTKGYLCGLDQATHVLFFDPLTFAIVKTHDFESCVSTVNTAVFIAGDLCVAACGSRTRAFTPDLAKPWEVTHPASRTLSKVVLSPNSKSLLLVFTTGGSGANSNSNGDSSVSGSGDGSDLGDVYMVNTVNGVHSTLAGGVAILAAGLLTDSSFYVVTDLRASAHHTNGTALYTSLPGLTPSVLGGAVAATADGHSGQLYVHVGGPKKVNVLAYSAKGVLLWNVSAPQQPQLPTVFAAIDGLVVAAYLSPAAVRTWDEDGIVLVDRAVPGVFAGITLATTSKATLPQIVAIGLQTGSGTSGYSAGFSVTSGAVLWNCSAIFGTTTSAVAAVVTADGKYVAFTHRHSYGAIAVPPGGSANVTVSPLWWVNSLQNLATGISIYEPVSGSPCVLPASTVAVSSFECVVIPAPVGFVTLSNSFWPNALYLTVGQSVLVQRSAALERRDGPTGMLMWIVGLPGTAPSSNDVVNDENPLVMAVDSTRSVVAVRRNNQVVFLSFANGSLISIADLGVARQTLCQQTTTSDATLFGFTSRQHVLYGEGNCLYRFDLNNPSKVVVYQANTDTANTFDASTSFTPHFDEAKAADGTPLYLVAIETGAVAALNASTLQQVWYARLAAPIVSLQQYSFEVSFDSTVAYGLTSGGEVAASYMPTGAKMWVLPVTDNLNLASRPLVFDGSLFVATATRVLRIRSESPVNGSRIQWTAKIGAGNAACSASSGGRTFVLGTPYGFVVALTQCLVAAMNKDTGAVLWRRGSDFATAPCTTLRIMGGYAVATCGSAAVLDLFTGDIVNLFSKSQFLARAGFIESATPGVPAAVVFPLASTGSGNPQTMAYALNLSQRVAPSPSPFATPAPYPTLPPGFVPANATPPTMGPLPAPSTALQAQSLVATKAISTSSAEQVVLSTDNVVYLFNTATSNLTARDVIDGTVKWGAVVPGNINCTLTDTNTYFPIKFTNVSTGEPVIAVVCATGIDAYSARNGTLLWTMAVGFSSPAGQVTTTLPAQYDPGTNTICVDITYQNASTSNTDFDLLCTDGVVIYRINVQDDGLPCETNNFQTYGNGTVAIAFSCFEGATSESQGTQTPPSIGVQDIRTGNALGAGLVAAAVPDAMVAFSIHGPYVAKAVMSPDTSTLSAQVIHGVTGEIVAEFHHVPYLSAPLVAIAVAGAVNRTGDGAEMVSLAVLGTAALSYVFNFRIGHPKEVPPPVLYNLPAAQASSQSTTVVFGNSIQKNGFPLLYVCSPESNGFQGFFNTAIDPATGNLIINDVLNGGSVLYALDDPTQQYITIVMTSQIGTLFVYDRTTGNYATSYASSNPSQNFLAHYVTEGNETYLVVNTEVQASEDTTGFVVEAAPLSWIASAEPWQQTTAGVDDDAPILFGAIADRSAVIYTFGPQVFASNPSNGTILWTANVPSYATVVTELVFVGNFIVAASDLGLWTLDGHTGNIVEDHRFEPCELGAAQPSFVSARDNRVLYSGTGGCLYLATIDPQRGNVSSVKAPQFTALASQVVLLPSVAVFVNAQLTTITAFDPVTLQRRWQLVGTQATVGPIIVANGRFVVIISTTNSVAIVDGYSGVVVRQVSIAPHTFLTGQGSTTEVVDNVLYALSQSHVVAVNVDPYLSGSNATGLLWVGIAPTAVFSTGNTIALLPSGMLLVTWSSGFGGFTPLNFSLVWQVTDSALALTFQHGYVLNSGHGANVNVYDSQTGALVAAVSVNTQETEGEAGVAVVVPSSNGDRDADRVVAIFNTDEGGYNIASARFPKPNTTAPAAPTAVAPQSSIINFTLPAAPTQPWTLAPGEQLPPLGCVAAVRDAVPAFVACVNRDVITAQLHLPLAGIDCTPVGAAFQRCVVLYTNAMIETGCGAGVGFLAQHLLPAANASASLPLCRPAGGSACATGDFCAALAVPSNSSLATAQHLPPGYAVYPSGAIPAFAPVPLTTTTTAAPTTTTTTTITTTVAPNTTTAVPNTTTTTTTTAPTTTSTTTTTTMAPTTTTMTTTMPPTTTTSVPTTTTTTMAPTTTITTTMPPTTTTPMPTAPRTTTTAAPTTSTTTTPGTATATPRPTTPPPTTTGISSTPAPITTNPTTGTSTNPPMPTTTLTPPPPTATTGSPPSTPAPPSGPLSPTLVAQYAADASLPSQAHLEAMLSQQLFSGRQAVTIVIVAEQYTAPKSITFAFAGANPMGVYNTAMDMGGARLAASIGAQSLAAASATSPVPAGSSEGSRTGLYVIIGILGAIVALTVSAAVLLFVRVRRLQQTANGNAGATFSTSIQSQNELRTVHGGSVRDPAALYASLLDEEDRM
jgi:hypothetical protein